MNGNKLPPDVEKWIFGHSEEVQDNTGALVSAIRTEDIEDLLSRYTLCEREPAAFSLAWPLDIVHGIINAKTTFRDRSMAEDYARSCMAKDAIQIVPLYAPARIE